MSRSPCAELALAEAIDALIHSALTYANHRYWSRLDRSTRPGHKHELDMAGFHTQRRVTERHIGDFRMLEHAWRRVPDVAERYKLDTNALVKTLDDYTRALLTLGRAHSWRNAVVMARQVLRAAAGQTAASATTANSGRVRV
ncbi:hypothetical protein [Phytoactinopolyspora mesophila]|uniref:Uncharacterized protein n=1 Tax=Phytoactinopolyspora mesophila TaxID=2650750 RepID=A0A7K3M6V3_9ACTN|nr:hypothetical protein [Phytoactinopolyspora mesophila]NDL58632.1 hypothetical protein [Phytoactinopolyspora mesophila]